MKAHLFTALLLTSGLSAAASAEVPGEYYVNGPAAATAAGDYLRGSGQVIRSAGAAVKDAAEAAVHIERAKSRYLKNNYEAVKTFWDRRLLWLEKRAELRGRPLSSEQLRRIARDAAPDRLSALQLSPTTGHINWPVGLQRPEFAELRAKVEAIFANRTIANAGVGSSSEVAITRLTKAMHESLKGQMSDMTTNEYIASMSFLRSLAYEARFTPGLEGVAQR